MLPISTVLQTLAQQRPIFHSEADFQHAFAWEIHRHVPQSAIRLEQPLSLGTQNIFLDLIINVGNQRVGIELKYKTGLLEHLWNGERYMLKNHGAHDLGRYDILKDLYRLECLVQQRQLTAGYIIAITNDSQYQNLGNGMTIDSAFRLFEGRTITGRLAWADHTNLDSYKSRQMPLEFQGRYSVRWATYSQLGPRKNQQFYQLIIPIRPL